LDRSYKPLQLPLPSRLLLVVWQQTPTSLGYFKGAIDELKIFNIALTDGQVSKLYNDEKP
jgi:hypothetical protein